MVTSATSCLRVHNSKSVQLPYGITAQYEAAISGEVVFSGEVVASSCMLLSVKL